MLLLPHKICVENELEFKTVYIGADRSRRCKKIVSDIQIKENFNLQYNTEQKYHEIRNCAIHSEQTKYM